MIRALGYKLYYQQTANFIELRGVFIISSVVVVVLSSQEIRLRSRGHL